MGTSIEVTSVFLVCFTLLNYFAVLCIVSSKSHQLFFVEWRIYHSIQIKIDQNQTNGDIISNSLSDFLFQRLTSRLDSYDFLSFHMETKCNQPMIFKSVR